MISLIFLRKAGLYIECSVLLYGKVNISPRSLDLSYLRNAHRFQHSSLYHATISDEEKNIYNIGQHQGTFMTVMHIVETYAKVFVSTNHFQPNVFEQGIPNRTPP
jgi:hypothetical protein